MRVGELIRPGYGGSGFSRFTLNEIQRLVIARTLA
jgi:hypothetical protein